MNHRSIISKKPCIRSISKTTLGLGSILFCSLFCARTLVSGEALSSEQFRVLKEAVRRDTPTAIISFKSGMKQNAFLITPDGQQTKADMPATELMHILGESKDILAVSGTFKLLQPIAGTFAAEEVVNERIPVQTRWGGDSVVRRLRALIPPVGYEQARSFIVVRPTTQAKLVDSLFIGPLADNDREETQEFLRFLVAYQGREGSHTGLVEMLQSGRLLYTRFALEELRMHDALLTARHYLLAVRALPLEHGAEIASDLFMEARRNRTVKTTMIDGLRFFLDDSSPEKEANVLNALAVAVERMSWKEDNSQFLPDMLLLLKAYQVRNSGDSSAEVSRAAVERVMRLLQSESRGKND